MKKTLENVIKKHAVIAVFSVLAVVIVVMSTTYAIFNSSHKNNEDQKIDIGTFDVTVTSSTGQIIITDIYPSTESLNCKFGKLHKKIKIKLSTNKKNKIIFV